MAKEIDAPLAKQVKASTRKPRLRAKYHGKPWVSDPSKPVGVGSDPNKTAQYQPLVMNGRIVK